jgi:hypothetical protein
MKMKASEELSQALQILRVNGWIEGAIVKDGKVCFLGALGFARGEVYERMVIPSAIGQNRIIAKQNEEAFYIAKQNEEAFYKSTDAAKLVVSVIAEQYPAWVAGLNEIAKMCNIRPYEAYEAHEIIYRFNDEIAGTQENIEAILEKAIVKAQEYDG